MVTRRAAPRWAPTPEALSRGEDGETAWTKISQRMTITFEAPDERDWVLHVRKQGA